MNLKYYVKYAGYIAVISCVALLSRNLLIGNNDNILSKSNSNGAENTTNRIIIKPSENSNSSERDTTDNGNGTRVVVPSTNNNSKVQPLPPADANAQIIINLLQ